MAADGRRLRRVLGRFKRSELPAVLRYLGVEAEEGARAATKQQLLASAVRRYKVLHRLGVVCSLSTFVNRVIIIFSSPPAYAQAGGIIQRDITRLELHCRSRLALIYMYCVRSCKLSII